MQGSPRSLLSIALGGNGIETKELKMPLYSLKNSTYGFLHSMETYVPYVFLLLFLASTAGIIYPYFRRFRRKHFAFAALGTFVGLILTIPEPTPEQLAARAAKQTAEKTEEARAEHRRIVEKAASTIPTNYTRAEYGQTYNRVGAKTFAILGKLELGAAYLAAESSLCNKVNFTSVSDVSKPSKAVFFVDCANENRFMVDQTDAQSALDRFSKGLLTPTDLTPSCTLSSVSMCKATPAQRAAKEKEIEFVSACDIILQQVVVSPSSLDFAGRWDYGFGKGDTVVIRRAFDSQNSFGAMIRNQYVCEIDALTTNIQGFSVNGPMGSKRVI